MGSLLFNDQLLAQDINEIQMKNLTVRPLSIRWPRREGYPGTLDRQWPGSLQKDQQFSLTTPETKTKIHFWFESLRHV